MSYFTVIGNCATTDQAEALAETLYKHIETIAQWHLQHPFQSKKLGKKPSPVEQDLAKRHNLVWDCKHEWLMVSDIAEIEETVSLFDKLVFITSGETSTDGTPFDTLMTALGAEAMIDHAPDAPLPVTITAQAPSSETAQALCAVLSAYLSQDGNAPCPWMVYVDGERDSDAELLLALDVTYLKHITAVDDISQHPDIVRLSEQMAQARKDEDAVAHTRYSTEREKRYEALLAEAFAGLPDLSEDDADILDDLREASAIIPTWDKDGGMPPYPTTILTDNAQITFKNVLFGEIASGLPALLTWLEAEGCTDVCYELG